MLAQVVVRRCQGGFALSGPSELAQVRVLFVGSAGPSAALFEDRVLPTRCSATLAEAWGD
jgi:hypothetical protein